MATLLAISLFVSPVNATENKGTEKDFKQGVQVIERSGYSVTVTTNIINEPVEQYIERLKAAGNEIHKAGEGNTSNSTLVGTEWLENDYFKGYGQLYSSASNQTGYIYCYNGHVGLNAASGHVDAYILATGASYNKARMKVTTYGVVGGTTMVARDYVFAPTDYAQGTSTFTVNEDLNGAIAYYQVSVYGDHKAVNNLWTSQANLESCNPGSCSSF